MGPSVEDLLKSKGVGSTTTGQVTFLPDPEPPDVWATIVSVDDHVVEPPEIFEDRFPSKFSEVAPRIVEMENGGQAWLWNNQLLPNVGFNAVAGRPRNEHSFEPTRFDHMRRGAWDSKFRLLDMDLNGIWASVCFPSFLPGFVGQRLSLWPDDEELALTAVRAYNDWHLESWCGADPSRFIPQQIPYLRDPLVAADEIRRNAERGFKAVTFSEAPHKLGLPSIHSRYWEPFFAACAETGTVLCLHVGSAGESPTTSEDAPAEVIGALFATSAMTSSIDWLYSGVPMRFPDIKICMSEGGIGWVGAVIDRIDHLNVRQLEIGAPPVEEHVTSDVLRRNFWFCALDDPSGFLTRDVIGVENILVESDYPHSDSTWPNTQELLREHLAHMPRDEQRKMCWENAVKLFRHPPPSQPLP